jgi:type VI secretion system protein ImpH
MATKSRRADPPLAQELFEEAYRFEFFQAVRLLERIEPQRKAVGRDADPASECVRFRTHQTLSFPPGEIQEITVDDTRDKETAPEMAVNFMGLTGPLGILPHHYTQLLMDRIRYRDTALWNFLDIFNHRMISFLFRVWEKHRFPIAYERGDLDQFTGFLFSLVGMGTSGLRGRLSFPDQALVFYGGQIAQRPHSASAVAAILGDYFNLQVELEQLAGQWLLLGENATRLGADNSALGLSAVAGTRVWDTQSKFRIRLGPLKLWQLKQLLPSGSAYKPLRQLSRLLVGLEFDFDAQLILEADEVPAAKLSAAEDGSRLGWTSWLKTRTFDLDDEQLVLALNDSPSNWN